MHVALVDVGADAVTATAVDRDTSARRTARRERDDLDGGVRAALAEVAAGVPPLDWLGLALLAEAHDAAALLSRLLGRPAAVPRPGVVVGELADGWGLPAALPVVAPVDRVQLSVLSAGGMHAGVVTVVGATVHLATAAVPGPGWRDEPSVVPGLRSVSRRLDAPEGDLPAAAAAAVGELVRQAVVTTVVVAGPARLAAGLADLLGRAVHPREVDLPAAAAVLVARAVGAHAHLPPAP